MMVLKSYDLKNVSENSLEFVVIVAKYLDKWVFVKHKERSTWEIPGGHREKKEDIVHAASRELKEETGAKRFDIYPISIYSISNNEVESIGELFFANILELGKLPNYEIESRQLFDDMPKEKTYPLIQDFLLNKAKEYIKNNSL